MPDQVTLEIDVRDIDDTIRDGMVARIRETIDAIGRRRGVEAHCTLLNSDAPARTDPAIVRAIDAACESIGLTSLRLVSRAYHDALFLARVAPMGMIFIPCKGGVSHRPDESSRPEEIGRGIDVLALTLARLSGAEPP